MKLSDRALNFSIRHLSEKNRLIESDKPTVLHSMIVGDILKRYGFDDVVVAAGYLHNIIEETNGKISNEDISRLFGGNVASLVLTVTDMNFNLPQMERRKLKVKMCKNLPPRNRAVIAAVEIANLEEMRIAFQKSGNLDFDTDFDNQKWYYESMLEILEEDFVHPIFNRLYENILAVFYNEEPDFLESYSRINKSLEYSMMQRVHAQKEELTSLINVLESPKPFIIEFTSNISNRTYSLVNIIDDFFKSGGFKIKVMNNLSPKKFEKDFVLGQSVDVIKRNLLIASEIEAGILTEISNGQNIIIIDSGLFDRLIWLQRMLDSELLSRELFQEYLNSYLTDIDASINYVVITSAINHQKGVNSLEASNAAINNCLSILNGNILSIDDNVSNNAIALGVLENLLPIMRADYIRQLKLFLDNKKSS